MSNQKEFQNGQESQNPSINQKQKIFDILNDSFFCFFFAWIGFVSSIDTYLVVKFRGHMPLEEKNPVARFIMAADNWDVSSFVGIKMFSTIFVLMILIIIYNKSKYYGLKYAFLLSLFQAGLFYYLLWI